MFVPLKKLIHPLQNTLNMGIKTKFTAFNILIYSLVFSRIAFHRKGKSKPKKKPSSAEGLSYYKAFLKFPNARLENASLLEYRK